MPRIVVIANPIAGTGRGNLSGPRALELLACRGCGAELLVTGGQGEAARLAAESAGAADLVVALGGDGTVHEVAKGLVGTGCPMAVLPAGSGNDFAAGIGCGTVELGLQAILAGEDFEVDACALDDRPFFNSVGLLGSGEVSARALRLWRWLGRNRYVLAGALTIPGFRGQRLRWDTPRHEGPAAIDDVFMMVEICNGPLTGGGFRFAPDADFSDGVLDACLVRMISPLTGLRLLPSASRGARIDHPAFSMIRGAQLQFTCDAPIACHRDGEPETLPAGTHVLRVLDQKLLVRRRAATA